MRSIPIIAASAALAAAPAASATMHPFRGGSPDRALTVNVTPHSIRSGDTYTVRSRGSSGFLFVSIQYGRLHPAGCPQSAQSEQRRAPHIQWLQINARWTGSYTGRFIAKRPGVRHLCAWTYSHKITTESRAKPTGRAGVRYTVGRAR